MRKVLFTDRWLASVFSLVTLMLVSACASEPTRIQLDRSVHFVTPEGKDVEVPSGKYRVEQATGAQIRLVPAGDVPPILLGAEAVQSDLDLRGPIAIAMPSEPDAYELILLLPDGPGLSAHGSVSGVQSRALFGTNRETATTKLDPNTAPDLVGCVKQTYNCICSGAFCCELGSTYAVVKNIGNGAAGPSKVRIGDEKRTYDVAALAPGAVTWKIVGWHDPLTPISVDALNSVVESSERNNTGGMCQ